MLDCSLSASLRRHRYLDERRAEDRGNEPPAETPVDALARLALAGGTFLGRPFVPKDRAGESPSRICRGSDCRG